jgi:hypothetical protein
LTWWFIRVRCQLSACRKQPILNFFQQGPTVGVYGLVAQQANPRIQLINCTVRIDSQISFAHAPPADK